VQCLTRSSVETSKFDLANALRSAFELMGCGRVFRSVSWMSKSQSEILDVLVPIYEKQNGDKPRVVACHGSRMWNIRNELS
jgi:dipeptidase D